MDKVLILLIVLLDLHIFLLVLLFIHKLKEVRLKIKNLRLVSLLKLMPHDLILVLLQTKIQFVRGL